MSPNTPNHPGGSIAEELDRRAREGRPVRIGLIGAGQMGTDIIVQTDLMTGIVVVAAADAVPENVFAARTIAGNGARAPELVDSALGAARAGRSLRHAASPPATWPRRAGARRQAA